MFFKIQDKLQMKESLNSRSIEMEKFEKGLKMYLKLLPDLLGTDLIGQELATKIYARVIIENIRKKAVGNMTEADIDSFLLEHGVI